MANEQKAVQLYSALSGYFDGEKCLNVDAAKKTAAKLRPLITAAGGCEKINATLKSTDPGHSTINCGTLRRLLGKL